MGEVVLLITLLALLLAGCNVDGDSGDTSGNDSSGNGNGTVSDTGGNGNGSTHVDETGISQLNDNTYDIYNLAGLKTWAEEYSSYSATLHACITWPTGETWMPVDTLNNDYTGTFDGGGHSVYNLSITSSSAYVGFFGYIGSGGEVKNLTLHKPSIAATGGESSAGGIAGYNSRSTVTGTNYG